MQAPRYRLKLDLDERAGSFRGAVAIEILEASGPLVLSSHELEITSLAVDGHPVDFELVPEREELRLAPTTPGSHRIEAAFRGRILEKGLIGLYRSAIPGGHVVGSMLYPNGARRVFPCFDEPAQKSVFEVTIEADAGSEVLFNTPAESTEVSGGRKTVRFAPTPKMSTYLVFLAVGRFALRERAGGAVRIRAATPPGREDASEFALEHAGRALAGFERYYGIPYPLPKLDLVSLTDFWAGAMENWGAIAFHETRLLVDPTTGVRSRRRVRETVTHEIAHQWFGNLVTMVWWNDFWLNESFAMFMQAKLDAELYPDLELWTEFFLSPPVGLRVAYEGDALRSTHPIEVEVHAPAELGQLADEITYGKGAGVLRMVEAYLGEGPFRDGVNAYLKRFAYGNARSQDLWESLQAASREPVARIMERWIRLEGHPVVRVRRIGAGVELVQERFLLDRGSSPTLWPIPLTYRTGGEVARVLFEGRELRLPLDGSRPLVVNPDRAGFYRVLYEGPLFEEQLARYAELSELDRWGLLRDSFSFVVSGRLPLGKYLELVRVAGRHPGPIPCGEVLHDLAELGPFARLLPEVTHAALEFVREIAPTVEARDRDGASEPWAALGASLLVSRIVLDRSYAREVAEGFAQLDRIPADRRVATIIAYALTAGPEAFPVLRDRMFAAGSEDEARQMMSGLVALEEASAVRDVLDLVLDPRMPASRSWTMLSALALTRTQPSIVWEWLARRLPEVDRLLSGTPLLTRTLEAAISTLGVYHPDEVREYFRTHAFPEGSRGVVKGLERLEIYLRFLRDQGALPGTEGGPRSGGPTSAGG